MGKQQKQNSELDNILSILSDETESISIAAIETKLDHKIDRRTLQRRLRELIIQKKVTASGTGRATRYTLAGTYIYTEPDNMVSEPTESLQLSADARKLQWLISQPSQKREPTGYRREFLENYKPNISSYLTKQEMKWLSTLGATAQMQAPAGTYAKQILQRLLIDLSWNSSRLEGNTYSLLDTQRLLDNGIPANTKSASEAQMILNHKDAIEFIVNNPVDVGFNRYSILSLHALLSNNLLPDPAASGRLRIHGVGIAGSVYTPPATPQLIEELFDSMLQKADQIKDPFEQAFFIMVQLPYFQPFDDVNKRVSRLAANIPLNKHNLSPLSFVEVPEKNYIDGLLSIYELNRIELLKEVFLWAYERSAKQYAAQRQSLGEPDPFRLRYRDLIRRLVAKIITEASPKPGAITLIEAESQHLPSEDQGKFIATVENELLTLHPGNFARYFVTPSQFQKWQDAWNNS